MRKFLLVGALLLIGSPAAAQVNTARQSFAPPMYTNLDLPVAGVTSESSWLLSAQGFQGWSVDCNTGRIPSSFSFWRRDSAGTYTNVPVNLQIGLRPDVQSYFASIGCAGGAVSPYLGWALTPVSPEPPGDYTYILLVTDLPYAWTCGANPDGSIWCDWVANQVYLPLTITP